MRHAPGLRPGDDASLHLADGPLFSAALEAMALGLARSGRLLGLDRRDTQRLARGARGLTPHEWLDLAGRIEASADVVWTPRKRAVARLIRERVAGVVPGPTAVFGQVCVDPAGTASVGTPGAPGAAPGPTPTSPTGADPERVIARAPLVGTHEHVTVERRADGRYGWRIGAAGELCGRCVDAEDAFSMVEDLVGEGCHPRARDADLTDMLVACMQHDARRMVG